MADLSYLAKQLEERSKEINKAASDVAVKAALTIVGDLAYHTPVDTSKALSNWQVSLNAPVSGNIAPYFHGDKGSTQKASAGQTLEEAKRILESKQPGQPIYITNNLPYIKRLNDGYSKQAPSGFVERAILIARKVVEKFKV